MAREKICGIYKITNVLDGKVYIGLSVDIKGRFWAHKGRLRRNVHDNIHLQRSWNKNKETDFVFETIEECGNEDLGEREKYYISLYNATDSDYGYNLTTGGEHPKVSKESIMKTSWKRSKRVFQFDKNGNFIAEYLNARQAAKFYGSNDSNITRCCMGLSKSAIGYVWKYKNPDSKDYYKERAYEDLSDIHKLIPKKRPIFQLDLDGNILNRWETCYEAEMHCNTDAEHIRSCCEKQVGRKTSGGYIWVYENELDDLDLEYHKTRKTVAKAVLQYDLNMNFIKRYESAREVTKETGINYKYVSAVCTGRNSHTGGFIFKFEKDCQ